MHVALESDRGIPRGPRVQRAPRRPRSDRGIPRGPRRNRVVNQPVNQIDVSNNNNAIRAVDLSSIVSVIIDLTH